MGSRCCVMAADRDDGSDALNPSRPTLDQPASERSAGQRVADVIASGPELRDRQLAEHTRYRLVVEAGQLAAAGRDTWSRAVPQLEAEWAAHQRRSPDRAHLPARTQPDGSWHGEGGRHLSPEQHAEAAKCAADLRDEARQSILPVIERVATADPTRQLAGLKHMLKGEDRLKEKIADELTAKPDQHVRSALDKIADAVRFTLVYPAERYADGIRSDVDRLKAEGFELIKLKNLWQAEQYKGVNSQWRVPQTDTRFEMQFHTLESREAKELTHEAYERIRSAAALPPEQRDFADEEELEGFQRRVNSLLITPPGTEAIEDFPQRKEKNSGSQDHLLRDYRRDQHPLPPSRGPPQDSEGWREGRRGLLWNSDVGSVIIAALSRARRPNQ